MYTRKPVFAGQFYSDHPDELNKEILAYLNQPANSQSENNSSKTDPNHTTLANKTKAKMLLLPHAGHVYCGETIGKTLSQTIPVNNIIILCPNHKGLGHNLAVWPNGTWVSPLGSVSINADLAQKIIDSHPSFQADLKAHEQEHSIEVLIPFIQCHSPHAQIVPISVSIYNFQEIDSIAKSLAKVINAFNNENSTTNIIVSSDMNHFEDQKISAKKDSLALAELINCNPEALLNTVVQNKISMCGISPAVLGLSTCLYNDTNDKCEVRIVEYTNSAKVNNNYNSVVGYCGVIVQ